VPGVHHELRPDVGRVGRHLEVLEDGSDEGPGTKPLHFVSPCCQLEALKSIATTIHKMAKQKGFILAGQTNT